MAGELKLLLGSIGDAISMTTDIADGVNTYDGQTNVTTTEIDNSTTLYPWAKATLYLPNGWLTTAPTDGTSIDLFMLETETDGASNDDAPNPSSLNLKGARPVGSFYIDGQAAGTAFRMTIPISLFGVKKCKFYLQNNSGQTMDYVSTAMTLRVTPLTVEPG